MNEAELPHGVAACGGGTMGPNPSASSLLGVIEKGFPAWQQGLLDGDRIHIKTQQLSCRIKLDKYI